MKVKWKFLYVMDSEILKLGYILYEKWSKIFSNSLKEIIFEAVSVH